MGKRTMTQIAGDLLVVARKFEHPYLYMCVDYSGHVYLLDVFISNRNDHAIKIKFSIYLDQFSLEEMKLFVKGIKKITNELINGENIVKYLPFYGNSQDWFENTNRLVKSETKRMCLSEKKNVSH